MTSERNKRIYLSSGSVKFGDLFNNRTVINDGWIEVTTPGNITYRRRVDDFGEPIDMLDMLTESEEQNNGTV